MLTVISPAKNLDYDTPPPTARHSKCQFLDEAGQLMSGLRRLAPQDIAALMGLFL